MPIDRRLLLKLSAGAAATGGATVAAARASRPAPAGAQPPTPAAGDPVRVAFLIDQGANVMDIAGPWETFQDNNPPGFRLYTVGPAIGPVTATAGLKIMVDHTFADAPQPQVLVMGAQGRGRDEAKLDWIRSVAPGADVVMSVCTGAFLLARTGLLDGLKAATHHDFYDSFATEFPKVELVRGRRWVDNGRFISAGGLTSGVDAALHVVSRYYGEAQAEGVADYMEYDSEGWRTGTR